MREVVVVLAQERGLALIGRDQHLAGVISAGDLTRLAQRRADFLEVSAEQVMTTAPRTVLADEFAAAAVGVMERHGIVAAPVLDAENRVVGVVHLHDLLRAGVV
jgi:arabinose-5-phosphate isomerase